MKTMRAWALLRHGELHSVGDIFDERDEALGCQNKPAGQRVVEVRILQVKEPKAKRIRRAAGKPVNTLVAASGTR
jgi:hypothetical protein